MKQYRINKDRAAPTLNTTGLKTVVQVEERLARDIVNKFRRDLSDAPDVLVDMIEVDGKELPVLTTYGADMLIARIVENSLHRSGYRAEVTS